MPLGLLPKGAWERADAALAILQIGTGTERFAGPGDDGDPGRLVAQESIPRRVESLAHRPVDGVESIRNDCSRHKSQATKPRAWDDRQGFRDKVEHIG